MRKKDYEARRKDISFFQQKGLTKRAAALMLVGALILTMMPVTASEIQETSELNTGASSQAAAAPVNTDEHAHSLNATVSGGGYSASVAFECTGTAGMCGYGLTEGNNTITLSIAEGKPTVTALTGDSALTNVGVSVGELSYWNGDSETTLGNAGTYTVKTTVTLPAGTTLSGADYADESNNTVVLAVTGSITQDSNGTELHNHTNVELHYTSSTSGTLTELFNTAPTDGCVAKVVLDKDYVGEGSVTVNSNRNIILDLNGHKIERTDGGSAIIVGRWGTLKIVNSQSTMGYITSTVEGYSGIYNRGALTIDSSNVTVKAGYGITTYLDSSNGCSDVSVTVTAGIIEGSVSGIYVQQASGTAGAQTTAITISGENTSIEGKAGSGIVLSQYISGATTLTVKDGAKITGKEFAIYNASNFYTGSKYEITGGTLTAANAVYRYYYTSNVEITGGTFVFTGINQNSAYSAVESTLSGNLTKYLGDGCVLVQNTAGDNSMSYNVTTESANYVAGTNLIDYVTKEVKATNKFDLQVGKWGFVVDNSSNPIAAMYKSITAAYSDASHTITLVDDIENGFFDIEYSGDFTIDLGTHTLKYDATKDNQITRLYGLSYTYNYLTQVKDKEGNEVKSWFGIFVACSNVNLTVKGQGDDGGKIIVTGDGTGAFGVANNGENTDSNIKLEDVAIEVSGAGSVGVYLPAMQSDTNTTGDIITGSTIKSAGTAVEVRAGKLTINEGTYLEATGTGDASITLANGGGTTTQNAALAVIQHTTKKPITVTINGGTFKGIAALLEADPQNNGTDSTNQINITVNAGTFNGAVYSADNRITIQGGTFAGTSFGTITSAAATSGTNYTFSNVTDKKLLDSDYRYLDSAYTYVKDFTIDNDGNVTAQYKAVPSSDVEAPEYLLDGDDVVEIRAIASHFIFRVGDEYGFTDWSKAVEKANGQEIKLINDVTDKGSIAVSNGTVTLDLNGHKLTNSTAESASVNVSGGQLTIKDSTDENGIIENSVSGKPAISVSGGKLIVESGTIKSSTDSAIEMTAGDLAVSGGTISGETYAVKAGDNATIYSITGGFLQGAIETKSTGFITSMEATFTKSFDDSFAMTDAEKTYGCVVKDTRYFGLGEIAVVSDKSDVTQAAGDTEAKVKSGSELSKDTDNKSKVLSAAEKTTVTGLENASKSNDNVADIENFLKSDKVKELNSEEINVVEVVYPVIEATSLNLDDSGDKVKSLGVEITAMVQLYATTGNAATEDALKQAVSDGTAVKADQATKLDTTGKVVEVTVPVSKDLGLISENTKNNVWIKHEVGGDSSNVRYYKASVTTEGDNYNVTFSNPDGFSPFTIMVTTLGNVTINDISYDASDVGYTSLPDVGTNNIEGYEVYIADAYKGVFSTFTDTLYQMLLTADPETVSFVAKTKSTGTSNTGTKTEGSNNKTNGDSTSGTTDAAVDANAAQTVDAAAGNASDTNIVSNTGTGNASNNAANGTRRTTQKQNETNADAEEVVEEEQQAAQPEESVVTEEVAQVEGGDLNADAADGGVIAETVGNSSSAWIWLIAVLACAAAAILLIVVFKRRKDENA